MRISTGDASKTTGPRTHILGFVGALDSLGIPYSLLLSSTFPGLGRFSRREAAVFSAASRPKVLVADLVRVGAMVWSGLQVAWRERAHRRDTTVIYERGAVFQSLASFHPAKRNAIRVVEANAVLSRETAHDRKAIVLEQWAAAIERHVFRRADLIVAVSAAVKRDVVEFSGVPEDRVIVLPNGASRTWTEADVGTSEPGLIGFTGTVVPWHRLDRVVECLATLEGASLEVIGEGPERERLATLAAGLGLADRVRFVGRMPHAEALKRMSRWSIGYAGHTKTWAEEMYHSPLKLYEYAALGMHIVCSPSGDAERLREDGIAMHPFDPEDDEALLAAFSGALAAAATESDDRRETQRAIVRDRHTWEARVEEFLVIAARLRLQ
ncbi:MAG: glycosyltransferase [Rhodoglobus sp.]